MNESKARELIDQLFDNLKERVQYRYNSSEPMITNHSFNRVASLLNASRLMNLSTTDRLTILGYIDDLLKATDSDESQAKLYVLEAEEKAIAISKRSSQ